MQYQVLIRRGRATEVYLNTRHEGEAMQVVAELNAMQPDYCAYYVMRVNIRNPMATYARP